MKAPPRSPGGHILTALPFPLEIGWFLQDFGYRVFPLAEGLSFADATTDKGELRRMCAPNSRAPIAVADDTGGFTNASDIFPRLLFYGSEEVETLADIIEPLETDTEILFDGLLEIEKDSGLVSDAVLKEVKHRIARLELGLDRRISRLAVEHARYLVDCDALTALNRLRDSYQAKLDTENNSDGEIAAE